MNVYLLPILNLYTLSNYINLIFINERMFLIYYDLLVNHNFSIDFSILEINKKFLYSVFNILKFLNNVLISFYYGLNISYKIVFNLSYAYILKFYFSYIFLFCITNFLLRDTDKLLYAYFYFSVCIISCASKIIFLLILPYKLVNDNILLLFLLSKNSNFIYFSRKYFYHLLKKKFRKFEFDLNDNLFILLFLLRILGFFIRPLYMI